MEDIVILDIPEKLVLIFLLEVCQEGGGQEGGVKKGGQEWGTWRTLWVPDQRHGGHGNS